MKQYQPLRPRQDDRFKAQIINKTLSIKEIKLFFFLKTKITSTNGISTPGLRLPLYVLAWRFSVGTRVGILICTLSLTHMIDWDNVEKLQSIPLLSAITGETAKLARDQLYFDQHVRSDTQGFYCSEESGLNPPSHLCEMIKWVGELKQNADVCWVQIHMPVKFCCTQRNLNWSTMPKGGKEGRGEGKNKTNQSIIACS